MSQDADAHAVTADPSADPPSTPSNNGEASEDQVYDEAVAALLGQDSPTSDASASGGDADGAGNPGGEGGEGEPGAGEGDPASEGGGETPDVELTDEQRQLLSRSHLTPEMLQHWSPEQRQTVLDNLAKREADTTRTFQNLKSEIDRLKGASGSAQGAGDPDPGTSGGGEGEGDGQPPSPETGGDEALSREEQQRIESLTEAYGEDIQPLAEQAVRQGRELKQTRGELQSLQSQAQTMARLTFDLATDQAIRDLQSEYPSLSKPDARQKVIDRAVNTMRSGNAPAEGGFVQRVSKALADAAKVEFSQSEHAAQVALKKRNQEQIGRAHV